MSTIVKPTTQAFDYYKKFRHRVKSDAPNNEESDLTMSFSRREMLTSAGLADFQLRRIE